MGLLDLLFDHPDAFLVGVPAVLGILIWWRLNRRDEWVALAHRAVRLVLVLTVLVVGWQCVEAAGGGGGRVGSDSVGVRGGDRGIAVQLRSRTIDPDEAPSSMLLSERGLTSTPTGDDGVFLRSALTQASFETPVPDPPAGAALAVVLSGAVSLLPWLLGLLATERILARSRRGEPFAPGNVRDLRWLAFAVSGAVYGAIAVDYLVATWLLADFGGDGVGLLLGDYSQIIGPRLVLPFLPFMAGALILALAEVWRAGIRLQDDVEATV